MKAESKIQQQIVMWYRNTYCTIKNNPRHLIFSVPNEGKDIKEQLAKRATGMLSGVSDLIVVRPDEVLFIECKDAKGKQREQQKNFQNTVDALGFEYHVVRSLEEFKKIIHAKEKEG